MSSSQTGMIMSEGHAVVVKPMKNSSLHLVYNATETILSGDPVDGVESEWVLYISIAQCMKTSWEEFV